MGSLHKRCYSGFSPRCAFHPKLEELALEVRRWTCPMCGAENDRDLNADQNLEQLVTKRTASSAGSDACGAEKSMTSHGARQVLRVEAGTDVRLALR